MSGIDVTLEDLTGHPHCIHGPTLLFSREVNGHKRYYFACSACRDRKKCSFFVWKDELESYVNKKITRQISEHHRSINHRQSFLQFNKVQATVEDNRIYCHTCSLLDSMEYFENHKNHDLTKNITDYQLEHPSELLRPLEDPKTEAQYMFSKECIKGTIEILKLLGYKNIICIGTPRIFEHLNSDLSIGINAILLDFDSRFHSFFGPLQFCWFNIFNNHFFKDESKLVFEDFLKSTDASNTILITDPPFGGRVEPIAYTLKSISKKYKEIHKMKADLPIFWIFPYFMESHILNAFNDFNMLDYKVDYENHPLFQSGKKGRKHGSPVRIFTNLDPSSIVLPAAEGYKFCSNCNKWISQENKHCNKCKACTSKDGRTYVHCNICKKCVKPSWLHCQKCDKCAQQDHSCEELPFKKECFHCKQVGHKKRDCPSVDQGELRKKRKLGMKMKFKGKKINKSI